MVTFVCDNCQDTVKKPKADNHVQRCSPASLSCVDCYISFSGNAYKTHTSCITEAEKQKSSHKTPKKSKTNSDIVQQDEINLRPVKEEPKKEKSLKKASRSSKKSEPSVKEEPKTSEQPKKVDQPSKQSLPPADEILLFEEPSNSNPEITTAKGKKRKLDELEPVITKKQHKLTTKQMAKAKRLERKRNQRDAEALVLEDIDLRETSVVAEALQIMGEDKDFGMKMHSYKPFLRLLNITVDGMYPRTKKYKVRKYVKDELHVEFIDGAWALIGQKKR